MHTCTSRHLFCSVLLSPGESEFAPPRDRASPTTTVTPHFIAMANKPLVGSGSSDDNGWVFSAFCCAYTAIDLNDLALCHQSEVEEW